jgi:thiamine pyrophosphokinase
MNNEIKICQILGPMQIDQSKINTKLFTIVVDGGTNHQLKFNHFISIGDGDSSNTPDQLQHLYPPEKDQTDFELALQLIPTDSVEVHLHGFLGGRLDHLLSVLGNAQRCLHDSKLSKIIFFDHNMSIFMFHKNIQINHQGLFSFLSFVDQKASITGSVKYPAKNVFIKSLSGLSISNVASGEINIECEQSAFLVCHSPQVK